MAIKRADIKPGVLVTVSKLSNATIWKVIWVYGFSVDLQEYGTENMNQRIDICYLRKPTKIQLKNAGIN